MSRSLSDWLGFVIILYKLRGDLVFSARDWLMGRQRVMLLQFCRKTRDRLSAISRPRIMLLIAFFQFILMRLVHWPNWLPIPARYADAGLYISAGKALVGGVLPDSVNQEHPPLAKYIIGVFSVYLKNPYASSFVFGLLAAIVVLLISIRLTKNVSWGALTVWILAYDQVNISLSIRPMLDIFMIFFCVLGVYLVITAERGWLRYCLAGLTLGFAVACKLDAVLYLIPTLLVLPYEHKLKETVGVAFLAMLGYASAYLQLLLNKGFPALFASQLWMLDFQVAHHVYGEYLSLWIRVLTPLIVHTTTLAPTGYGGCPPDVFGLPLSTIAETVNTPLLLLAFPVLYWLLRHQAHASPQEQRALRLLIGIIITCMIYEAAFPFTVGVWYFAPLGTALAISAPAMFKQMERSRRSAYATYAMLTLLTIWLIPANGIYFACGIA